MIPGYREPDGAPPIPLRPVWWRVAWCKITGLHPALEMVAWEHEMDWPGYPVTRNCPRCGGAFAPMIVVGRQ